jgi:hypothetical protein
MDDTQDRIKKFRAKLAALKRAKRFVGRRESYAVSHELEAMFAGLSKHLPDARKGVELVAAFYEADCKILDHCDDSDGTIGDVFRFTALEYFVHYGALCEDKDWLAALVLKLYSDDDYGVRDAPLDSATSYLPEHSLRGLVEQLWQRSARETVEHKKHHWLYGIESLAKQLRDGPLFEKACRALRPKLSTVARIDIARIYWQSGQPETALRWLDSIPLVDDFMIDRRDELLLEVCTSLGDRDRVDETAWRIFRRNRSRETLSELLEVVGKDQREQMIDREAELILVSPSFSHSDAGFLIDVDRLDEAEDYVLNRVGQLNGNFYTALLPLAEGMVKAGRLIAATVIYRALLESILARAISKYYTHGLRYLRKLDTLSLKIDDWGDVFTHENYKAELRRIHARKSSFWSRYGA